MSDLALAASMGVLFVLLAGVIAVPDIYFVHFWLLLGLMLAAENVHELMPGEKGSIIS